MRPAVKVKVEACLAQSWGNSGSIQTAERLLDLKTALTLDNRTVSKNYLIMTLKRIEFNWSKTSTYMYTELFSLADKE